MMKAKYNQETRDNIERLFIENNYTSEQQIEYLEVVEREKYNYYCDVTYYNWKLSDEDMNAFESEWNEVKDMLNERK